MDIFLVEHYTILYYNCVELGVIFNLLLLFNVCFPPSCMQYHLVFYCASSPKVEESPEMWDCTPLSWPHILIISPILGHYPTHEAIQGVFALYLNTPLHMEDSFID